MTREQMIDEAVRCMFTQKWRDFAMRETERELWLAIYATRKDDAIRAEFRLIATRERCAYKSETCTLC